MRHGNREEKDYKREYRDRGMRSIKGGTLKDGRFHLQDILAVVAFDDNPLPGLLS